MRVNLDNFQGLVVINYTAVIFRKGFSKASLTFFFNGFKFSGTLAVFPGDMAFLFIIIISYPRDLFNLIPGFPGKGDFRRFIIALEITVFPRVILQ